MVSVMPLQYHFNTILSCLLRPIDTSLSKVVKIESLSLVALKQGGRPFGLYSSLLLKCIDLSRVLSLLGGALKRR